MLDNSEALLFIRGERPVKDKKYDVLKHPNIKLTEDGGAEPYVHERKEIHYELPDLHYEFRSIDDFEFFGGRINMNKEKPDLLKAQEQKKNKRDLSGDCLLGVILVS